MSHVPPLWTGRLDTHNTCIISIEKKLKLKHIAKSGYYYSIIIKQIQSRPSRANYIIMDPAQDMNMNMNSVASNVKQPEPNKSINNYESRPIEIDYDIYKIIYTLESGQINIYMISSKNKMRRYSGTFEQLMNHQSNRLLAPFFNLDTLNEWFKKTLDDEEYKHIDPQTPIDLTHMYRSVNLNTTMNRLSGLITHCKLRFEIGNNTDSIMIPFVIEDIGDLKMESIKPGLSDIFKTIAKNKEIAQQEKANERAKKERTEAADSKIKLVQAVLVVINIISLLSFFLFLGELRAYETNNKIDIHCTHSPIFVFISWIVIALSICAFMAIPNLMKSFNECSGIMPAWTL